MVGVGDFWIVVVYIGNFIVVVIIVNIVRDIVFIIVWEVLVC